MRYTEKYKPPPNHGSVSLLPQPDLIKEVVSQTQQNSSYPWVGDVLLV